MIQNLVKSYSLVLLNSFSKDINIICLYLESIYLIFLKNLLMSTYFLRKTNNSYQSFYQIVTFLDYLLIPIPIAALLTQIIKLLVLFKTKLKSLSMKVKKNKKNPVKKKKRNFMQLIISSLTLDNM